MNANAPVIAVAALAALIFLVFLIAFFSNLRLWIQALMCGVPVSLVQIIGMRLRRVPAQLIVHTLIVLRQRGERVPAERVERTYLAFALGTSPSPNELAELVLEKRGEDPW